MNQPWSYRKYCFISKTQKFDFSSHENLSLRIFFWLHFFIWQIEMVFTVEALLPTCGLICYEGEDGAGEDEALQPAQLPHRAHL
jgi:hypothetical protein